MEPTTRPSEARGSSLTIPIAIVIAGLLVAGALIFTGSRSQNANNVAYNAPTQERSVNIKPVTDKDHILGNPKAKLLIVEYSDLECPFCKQFHTTLKQIMNDFGATSEVAWVYRHFPIYKGSESRPPLHSKAGKEAEATECAAQLGGNDAFWKYTHKIYDITPSNNGLDLALLPQIAQDIGLNRAAFTQCLDSGTFAGKIEQAYNDAIAAGADGTPFTVIIDTRDGKPYPVTGGAIPYTALATLIRSILSKN